jgi:hypothetical protein
LLLSTILIDISPVNLLIDPTGYAIARRFLQEGAKSVATVSRYHPKIKAAYRRMREDLMMKSPPFFFIVGDITDPELRETKINNNGRLVCVNFLFPCSCSISCTTLLFRGY